MKPQPCPQHAPRLEEGEGPVNSEVEQTKWESIEEQALNSAWGSTGKEWKPQCKPENNIYKTEACGRTSHIS